MEPQVDNNGRAIAETYKIIGDPDFERRLKAFDPHLKLVFDQKSQRWVILEHAYDNSGWNIILICQDENKNPMPLGEWVFNRLFVYRHNYDERVRVGSDAWLRNLQYQLDCQKAELEEDSHDDGAAMIRDDIQQWRRAIREMDNRPGADAVAGYAKRKR